MRTLKFEQNNVGGLLNILLIPREAYRGVINKELHYVDSDNVFMIEALNDSSYSYTEEQQVDDAGDSWLIRTEGVIPGMSIENEAIVRELERREYYVLTTDQNGELRLCGDDEVLPRFLTSRTTGKSYTALNGISFNLEHTQANPSLLINSVYHD